MITIVLGREYYSKTTEILDWASERFGAYAAYGFSMGGPDEHVAFHFSEAFGHSTYTFDNDDQAAEFLMHWGGRVIE